MRRCTTAIVDGDDRGSQPPWICATTRTRSCCASAKGRDERRGGEPGIPRSASHYSVCSPRPSSSGRRKRASRSRCSSFLGAAAGHPLAGREGRCVVGGVVPGKRGRQCHRRCRVGTRLAERPHANELAARHWADTPILRGAPERPAVQSKDHFTSQYMDVPNDPLYPFGHGLTYGRFSLDNFVIASDQVAEKDTLRLRVDVTNEGSTPPRRRCFCSSTTRWQPLRGRYWS